LHPAPASLQEVRARAMERLQAAQSGL